MNPDLFNDLIASAKEAVAIKKGKISPARVTTIPVVRVDANATDRLDDYTFRAVWSLEDGQHVGLCDAFPSLSWIADSPEAALTGIRRLITEIVTDMHSNGDTDPPPSAINK